MAAAYSLCSALKMTRVIENSGIQVRSTFFVHLKVCGQRQVRGGGDCNMYKANVINHFNAAFLHS